MNKVYFGDIVRDVKVNVDRSNNPYEYCVAGDHMDTEELRILRRGKFSEPPEPGPAFIRVFKPGQILYGSRRTYLKKIAVADFAGVCANTTFVLETKDENIFLQRLLPFLMYSERFTQYSINNSKGSTNPYILFSDLAKYEFDLPPIAEQHKLADLLWAAVESRNSYKELLAASDALVRSQFVDLFVNRDTHTSDWRGMTIGDACTLVNGKAFKPSDWGKEGVPIVRIQNLNDETAKFNYFNGEIEGKYRIQSGALLFSWSGTPGTSFGAFIWNRGEAVLNQHIFNVIPHIGIDKMFLKVTLDGRLDEIIEKAHGGVGLRHITKSELEAIKILMPPMPIQKQFVELVQQADKSKFKLQRTIYELEATYKALLREAWE